jgi:predicted metal-dependent phosphoesterase TrpH/glycosyltransferase involved in cell wall biosynthesis
VKAALHIALVTPFSWSTPSAVNQHVADLALELKALGHRPVLVTSSDDPDDLERIPLLFRRARGQVINLLGEYCSGAPASDLLLPASSGGLLARDAGIPVIPLGSSFPVRLNGGVANLGLPVDVVSRLERLMLGGDFDLVHVHEPVAPSLSFTALRESRSPVVGTFHLTPVGVAAYELSQSVLDRFFDRLDARIVTFPRAAEMMAELFPGDYQVIPCGTRLQGSLVSRGDSLDRADESEGGPGAAGGRVALYVYRGDARRSYRAFLRTLTTEFPSEVERVVVALHRGSLERWLPKPTPRKLRDKIDLYEFDAPEDLAPLYKAASVVILPYLGGEWLCVSAAEALAYRRPVVGPDLAPTRDIVATLGREGVKGAVFSASTSGSLRAALGAVLDGGRERPAPMAGDLEQDRGLMEGPAELVVAAADVAMAAIATRLDALYRETLGATSAREGLTSKTPISGHSLHFRGIGEEPARRRVRWGTLARARSDWINADLHVHTCYSKDCASPLESILETAREVGLGALAIADHNEIEGAFVARELSGGDPLIIVAEEVKTAEGEVIGLFLEKAVPRGLSFDETLSLIKEQGGLVYVPHPFDALRTTPSYRALVDNLHRIDVIEIYNAKVALSSFNLAAERFAAKYNVVAGAGSDSHVIQGLGTAMLRMPRFDDPASFMAALWEADIIAKRKNLLYLQSLKLLQTTLDRVLPED